MRIHPAASVRRLFKDNHRHLELARLMSWRPGDVINGEAFTRAGTNATYFDVNGVLQLAGANVKRDGHYVSGNRTMLIEGAATNIVVAPRDLTNAAWVHTTMTPAKDQTGIDGVANSASSLLATGAAATSLQTVVLASSTRAQQCWVKRLVGAGAVSMTMDNVTFTAIAVTGAWTKVTIPSQAALTNPVIGFKLATSGDKIAVDYVHNETGTFLSSPVIGTRAGEVYTLPFLSLPRELSVYLDCYDLSGAANTLRQFSIAAVNPRFLLAGGGGSLAAQLTVPASSSTSAASVTPGDRTETRSILGPDGAAQLGMSLNGAAEIVNGKGAAGGLPAPFGDAHIFPGTSGAVNSQSGYIAMRALKILWGSRSMAELRAA